MAKWKICESVRLDTVRHFALELRKADFRRLREKKG